LPDFFVAYGQYPNKKWPKLLLFRKVMVKITRYFNYGNLHIHTGVSNCLEDSIFLWFCQKNVVLPKKHVFTLKRQFLP